MSAVSFETMELSADAGLTMTSYTAEPGSPDEERLRLLATWAATELAPLDRPVVDPRIESGADTDAAAQE